VKPLEAALSLARAHGLAVEEPVVLRDLSNLLVHLRPSPVVARVATTTATARGGGLEWLTREVEVAGFLVAHGAPVVAPAAELPPGPHLHEGWAITFWRHVEHDATPGGAEVGEALLALHEALASYPGELPGLADVLDAVEGLLGRVSDGLHVGEPQRLHGALTRVRGEPAAAGLPEQALHGDAHAGNLLRTAAGPRWVDLEDTCRGPAEWDLACLVANARVLGLDPRPGAAALAAYGRDPADPALGPFVEARALQIAGVDGVHGRAASGAPRAGQAAPRRPARSSG
jgi:Phosphotransferase enzyme family